MEEKIRVKKEPEGKPVQIIVQVGGQPPLGKLEDDYGTPIYFDESALKGTGRGECQEQVARIWAQGYIFTGSFQKYGDTTMTIWTLREAIRE